MFCGEGTSKLVSAVSNDALIAGTALARPRIRGVHLRRALLLFAIVLGLAAIAASVSRPRSGSDQTDSFQAAPPAGEKERAPSAAPAPEGSPPAAQLTFFARDPGAQRVEAGQAATVFVEVEEPGQVEIAELGVSAVAEPLTPARF